MAQKKSSVQKKNQNQSPSPLTEGGSTKPKQGHSKDKHKPSKDKDSDSNSNSDENRQISNAQLKGGGGGLGSLNKPPLYGAGGGMGLRDDNSTLNELNKEDPILKLQHDKKIRNHRETLQEELKETCAELDTIYEVKKHNLLKRMEMEKENMKERQAQLIALKKQQ
jgi:hypothetical protein